MLGCPIRKSTGQRSFAPYRSLSQLITSFIACESLGIRHSPFSTFARTGIVIKKQQRRLIYFQLNFLPHLILYTKRGDSLYILLSLSICQRTADIKFCPEWKPEGLKLSAGPFPDFLCSIYYLQRPESCSTLNRHLSCEPRSTADLRRFLFSSERRCSRLYLEQRFLFSSERRCSSRTFRYGYLVTT